MKTSKINSQFQFGEEIWCVSVINTGVKLGGHSVLVVEGLKRGVKNFPELFVGQYDIRARTFSPPKSVLENAKGLLTEVRCFEENEYKRNYSEYKGKSYLVTPNNVNQMIASIKADKEKVDKFMQELNKIEVEDAHNQDEKLTALFSKEENYLKYQQLGKHSVFTDPQEGDNCAGWCNEKLAVAGVGDGKEKPKPKISSGECVIS